MITSLGLEGSYFLSSKNQIVTAYFQDVIILDDKIKMGCSCYLQTNFSDWLKNNYQVGPVRQQARKKQMVSALLLLKTHF